MGYNNGNCFEVDTYAGNELNWLCKSVYDNLGRIVESSWGKDGGVDLTIKKYRGILCIQCKSGKNQVGTPEIRDFNTACQLKGGEGWMISIGGYSRDAIRLAEDLGIDLLDYSDLCADAKKANMKLLYFGKDGFYPVMYNPSRNNVFVIGFVFEGLANSKAGTTISIDGSRDHALRSNQMMMVTMLGGMHTLRIRNRSGEQKDVDLNILDDVDIHISYKVLSGYVLELKSPS